MFKYIVSGLVSTFLILPLALAGQIDSKPEVEVVKLGSATLNVVEIRVQDKTRDCEDPYGDDAWGSDIKEECAR